MKEWLKNKKSMSLSQERKAKVPVYEGLEDEKLMALYVAGDELAFKELFLRYKGRVYAYLYRAIRNERVVDDLFQLVFLRLHRSRGHFDEARVFAAWLFAICRNVVRDYLRKEKARPELGMEDPAQLEAGVVAEEENPSAMWKSVLEQMPERQKKAMQMRFGENLDFSEIAKELKTSEANARQIISRTVRKVRDLLK